MNKYDRLKAELADHGIGTMKCYGASMLPILANPSLNTFVRQTDYQIGDIVFCKVKGRYIDAHKITRRASDGRYLISNNYGYDNGWTRTIYGRVIRSEDRHGTVKDLR